MRITYQLTHDDYAEGTRHRRIDPLLMSWLLWMIPIGLAMAQFLAAVPGPAMSRFRGYLLLLVLGGGLCAVMGMGLHGVRRVGGKPWKRRYVRPPLFAWMGLWMSQSFPLAITVIFALLAAHFQQAQASAARANALPFWELAIFNLIPPLVPAVVCIGTWLFISPFLLSTRRLWTRQRHLHRPCTVEISEQSIRFSEPLSIREYLWEFFPGFTETPNEFVLYIKGP